MASTHCSVVRFGAQKFNPLIGLLLSVDLVFLVFAIFAYIKKGVVIWQPPCLMLIPLAIYFAAFAGWHIEITGEKITAVTFFWWKRSIRRADITDWAMKVGWKKGQRIGSVPYQRLEIYSGKNTPPFMIFTKVLKREELQKLFSYLPSKLQSDE